MSLLGAPGICFNKVGKGLFHESPITSLKKTLPLFSLKFPKKSCFHEFSLAVSEFLTSSSPIIYEIFCARSFFEAFWLFFRWSIYEKRFWKEGKETCKTFLWWFFIFKDLYICLFYFIFFCYLVIKIGTHFEFLRQGLVEGYRQQVLFIIITKGGGGLYHRSTRMWYLRLALWWKMFKHTLKILWCKHRKIFEVCLAIFQHYEWKR